MKIAFDGQLFLKGDKTGIGWCADNIIRNLAKDKNYECQLNCFVMKNKEENFKKIACYEKDGLKIKKCKWFNDVIYKILSAFFPIPYSWFFGKNSEITQFFNFSIPPGVKGKKVTIIHDMAYKACPETVRKKTKIWLELTMKRSCRRADKIITVSEFSKSEIIKYLKVPKEKIVVMPNGVDLSVYHSNYKKEEIEFTKKKYKINEKYILYLGTLEPRKNIIRMIRAYSKLSNENLKLPKLVLAGKKGWMCEEIFKVIQEENIEKDVIITGYIDAEDSPKLLCGAELFLFPSIYEGFGMPALEAMACGTPVIASNNSSLPEVVGNAGILINPFSEKEIKEAMLELLSNETIKEEMLNKGLNRAKQYTWSNSVEVLQKIYKDLIELS